MTVWESLDFARYAANYLPDFATPAENYQTWMHRKRRVNAAKSYIGVGLSDLSFFSYPGEKDLMVATFDQNYRSSNYKSNSQKRQY